MGYLGKDYQVDSSSLETLETTVSYLKLINVPTMFDIGCSQADPNSDFLVLNMIDDKSFRVEQQDYLASKHKIKKSKIKKFTGALKSIHTSLFVSEVTIIPLGVTQADDNMKTSKANKEEKKRDASP